MKKNGIVFSLLLALTCGQAYAQSASQADSGVMPARGMDKGEYAELTKAKWEKLKVFFDTRKRTKDPFGTAMDPSTVKEEVVAISDLVETKAPVIPVKKEASLQEAVDKFQVNGVNAKKQMVMVGFRSLRRGDPVEIRHDGELFKLRIVKITVNEVVFMNTKNQQTASVRLGVVKGIKRTKGKGLQNSLKKGNEPLQIK